MRRTDFEFLITLLRNYAGWNFDEEQYFVVDKKISNFIREKGYASVEDLVAELKLGSRPLISQVVESLALSDTSFYRDYDVFSRFENTILPAFKETNRSSKKLRILSVGCSTGQETYSIAMGIRHKFLGLGEWDIDIIGTDISGVAISKAQRGVYNNFEVQMGLNARSILEFFHLDVDQWQVNDDLRQMVEFRRYNLLDDFTFTDKFEIIFCRNVLRFFTPEYQEKILAKLSAAQTEGGILYLGKNEHIEPVEQFYDKLPGYNCAYSRKNLTKNAPKPLERSPAELATVRDDNIMPSFVRPQTVGRHPFASNSLIRK